MPVGVVMESEVLGRCLSASVSGGRRKDLSARAIHRSTVGRGDDLSNGTSSARPTPILN